MNSGEEGAEFIEIRASPDYDAHYRAKSDAYWDRVADVRRAREDSWEREPAPLGLTPAKT